LFEYYENSPRKKSSLDKKSSILETIEPEVKINKKEPKKPQKLEKAKAEKPPMITKNQPKPTRNEINKK
jgi:hypothetical protein